MKNKDGMSFELRLNNGDWVVTNGETELFRHTDKACLIRRMVDKYCNNPDQLNYHLTGVWK